MLTHQTSQYTADTAVTQYIDVDGVRLAYRAIGAEDARPIVLATRLRGVMDEWDPAFLDELGARRRVYWFDSAGVGLSSGEVPDSIPGMAQILIRFVEALGLHRVDLLGWSMGGYVIQSAALKRPDLVRRLIVAGSGPGGVPNAPAAPSKVWEVAGHLVNSDEDFLYLFFPETPEGIAAGRNHLARLGHRSEGAEPMVRPQSVKMQVAAFTAFHGRDGIYPRLAELSLPILYANGAHDVMLHAYNSYVASQEAPNAQLMLYPAAGHGFLFQCHSQFVRDVHQFLDAE
jgi:pimeloyl-ACP methyl ester carboxylesterase